MNELSSFICEELSLQIFFTPFRTVRQSPPAGWPSAQGRRRHAPVRGPWLVPTGLRGYLWIHESRVARSRRYRTERGLHAGRDARPLGQTFFAPLR